MLLQTLCARAQRTEASDEEHVGTTWPKDIHLTPCSPRPPVHLLPVWADAVTALVRGVPPARPLQTLLEDVLDVCMQFDEAALLMAKHIHTHIAKSLRAELEDVAGSPFNPASRWLQTWIERWAAIIARLRTLDMLFYPLFERARALEPQHLWDVFAQCVYNAHVVLRSAPRQAQLHRALQATVQALREHQMATSVWQQVMHTARQLRWDMRVFWEEATPFYRAMSTALAADVPMDQRAAQIPVVLAAIRHERVWSRCVPHADPHKTATVVVTEVAQPHLAVWAQAVPWLCEHAPSGLEALLDLSHEANLCEPLRQAVREHVQQQVTREMQAATPSTLLPRLLEAQAAWHALCVAHLRDSPELHHAVNDALESAINVRRYRVVERLAAFVDERLREAGSWASEDIEATFTPIISLFRCIYDKDLFQRLYQRQLAQRLLQEPAVSMHAEEAMLARLRQECGPDYTHRLETMCHDQQALEALQEAWACASPRPVNAPFPIGLHVLTQAHWPAMDEAAGPVAVPPSVEAEALRFEAFYRAQHPNRSLHWHHALDTVELRAHLGAAGVKELHVSAPQALVLLQFQDTQAHTYAHLREATGLSPDMLQRTLRSLVDASTPVLCHDHDSDTYSVNETLNTSSSTIALYERDEEAPLAASPVEPLVTMNRDVVLQAAAMRILKATSPMTLAHLTAAMQEQVRSRYVRLV